MTPTEENPVHILRSSNLEPLMSALGQKQTLTPVNLMSALPPKAEIDRWPAKLCGGRIVSQSAVIFRTLSFPAIGRTDLAVYNGIIL